MPETLPLPPRPRPDRRIELGVVLLAVVLAAVGARPGAGSWNDGGRLATAEAVGEPGTLAIDESVFVRVPPVEPGRPHPYHSTAPIPQVGGTLDRLYIHGRFYSDKPPVLGVAMGSLYRVWLAVGGPTAAERPDLFCLFLTLATSGLAYVFAAWCVVRLGAAAGLTGGTLVLLGVAFAAATVAPVYARHVNGHEPLLGVAAGVCLVLSGATGSGFSRGRALGAGALVGAGYSLDPGLGPGLALCTAIYVVVGGGLRTVAPLILAAAPFAVAHHALNYVIGGTIAPANTVPEYLAWPGSPFSTANMTGGLKHDPLGLLQYAADLAGGRKGFLTHNLPLWLAPGGAVLLWLRRPAARPVVAFAAGWVLLGGLPYAATSNNWSGVCCSVRWFVPFLAPGFWVLAIVLQELPQYRPDFAWATTGGVVLAALMWQTGPWAEERGLALWPTVGVTALGCGVIRYRAWRRGRTVPLAPAEEVRRAA